MPTFKTSRGEPRSKCATFIEAYQKAIDEARRTGEPVRFHNRLGTFEVPATGDGWSRVRTQRVH